MTQLREEISYSFNEWVESLAQAFAHTDGEYMQSDALKSDSKAKKSYKQKAEHANTSMSTLGIPEDQMTAEVSLAVSALMEKIDDVSRELVETKENLVEIERLVDVDPVVPIPNRRAFMRRLSWALTMYKRYGHPSTILYFDLNDFKQINDTYGHAAGDLAIHHITQLLSNTMRESDFLARIGGDEFAVIMYYAEEEAAKNRGAKIAEKLKKTPMVFNSEHITLSTAYGYYCIKSGDDAASALAFADTSMYVDKRNTKKAQLEAGS